MTVLPQQLLMAVSVNDSLSFAFSCVCPRSLAGPVPSRCVATNQGHIRSHFSGGRSAGVRYDKLSNNKIKWQVCFPKIKWFFLTRDSNNWLGGTVRLMVRIVKCSQLFTTHSPRMMWLSWVISNHEGHQMSSDVIRISLTVTAGLQLQGVLYDLPIIEALL